MLTQVLLNGLFSSSLYCLVALGLTLILGVMDIADFAQGAIYMVGAFVAFLVSTKLGLSFGLALPIAIAAAVVLGIVNNQFVYEPVRRKGASTLIAALGVLLIIQNIALLIFGSDFQTYPPHLVANRSKLVMAWCRFTSWPSSASRSPQCRSSGSSSTRPAQARPCAPRVKIRRAPPSSESAPSKCRSSRLPSVQHW
jgi:branched-subunit amino acid ABC-type transport system permease component